MAAGAVAAGALARTCERRDYAPSDLYGSSSSMQRGGSGNGFRSSVRGGSPGEPHHAGRGWPSANAGTAELRAKRCSMFVLEAARSGAAARAAVAVRAGVRMAGVQKACVVGESEWGIKEAAPGREMEGAGGDGNLRAT